jgi:hypothetical protein
MIAGRGLIERRHRPRAQLDAPLPLAIENGAPVLPETVLWALNLQEGDLLTVESEDSGIFFHSYLCQLEFLLDVCAEPWPFVEPVLRKPMAAVGPNGTLRLPEAAALLKPQEGTLVLRQLILPAGMFELQRTAGAPSPTATSLAAKPA